jgi:YfiH family protein
VSIALDTTGPRRIRETFARSLQALDHPGWADDYPWLVQGTTTRGVPGRELDLGLFSGGSPETVVRENWGRLLASTAMTSAVHARQVHEAVVRFHGPARSGLRAVEPCDGHATDQGGLLVTVSVADCVPVFLVSPHAHAVAALHAGWRGTVAGILERGLELLAMKSGADVSELRVHLGPAICGVCYEVGPEVFAALGQAVPRSPCSLDLRSILTARAMASGVDPSNLTVSSHCTRCTESGLYSHRGGDLGRQVGYIGVRP